MIDVPDELKKYPHWICHKKKVPKNPTTGKNCRGGYENWGTTYEKAVDALNRFKLDGLGYVFKDSDPFCGIDLDHCIGDGGINSAALGLIQEVAGYTEISPSGTGVHIIARSDNGPYSIKKGDIEIYTQDRYFTMTGHHYDEYGQIHPLPNVNPRKIYSVWSGSTGMTGEEFPKELTQKQMVKLLRKMKSGKGSERFKELWSGDFTEYDSQSEADLALCSTLAFYTDNNHTHIDQFFRKSKLMRDKWDRSVGSGRTYGEATIERACEISSVEDVPVIDDYIFEMDDFMQLELPEIKTIMEPWLSFGSTHMIYAARGVGKTYFAMSLSLAVTHGTSFGSWELQEGCNTLYVDGEMLPQDMKARITSLLPNLGPKTHKWQILSSGIMLQQGKGAINIGKEKWQDAIYDTVVNNEIKLIFLDNISALTPGVEENESTSWDSIASWVLKIKQTGCAVVLIHHAGKNNQQRGTSSREDALDTVIYLKSISEGAMDGVNAQIIFEKSRHIAGNAVKSMNFGLISEPGSTAAIWNVGTPENSTRDKVIEMLVLGKTYNEISETFNVAKKTITKYKKFATDKQWIEKGADGLEFTNLGRMVVTSKEMDNYDF